jgi:hypothetical protein
MPVQDGGTSSEDDRWDPATSRDPATARDTRDTAIARDPAAAARER